MSYLNSDETNLLTLQSLNELITALSEGEQSTYNGIIRSTKLSSSLFEKYCSWSNETYTRNCIVANEKFELILLCWNKGHITPIHSHGGEECWVKIIEGAFKETIYTTNEEGELKVVKSILSKSNDVTYMVDFMGFHRLENLSDKRSMSLHLYAKPIHNCEVFDENAGKFVNKELAYCTTA